MLLRVNRITVAGNVTRDGDMQYTQAGKAMLKFGVAYNHNTKNPASGEWEPQPTFFNVIVWGDLAERVFERVKKGVNIYIEGRMENNRYPDRTTGETRDAWQIVANTVQVLDGTGGNGGNGGTSGGYTGQPTDDDAF